MKIDINEFRNDILSDCTQAEMVDDSEVVNFLVSHIVHGHKQHDPIYIEKWLPMSDGKLFIEIGKEIAKLNDDKLTKFLRTKYREWYFV